MSSTPSYHFKAETDTSGAETTEYAEYTEATTYITELSDNPALSLATTGITKDIQFYLVITLIIFGICGNCVTLAVMVRSKKIGRTALGRFLAALAVSDSLALTVEFFKWLDSNPQYLVHVSVSTISDLSCKLTSHLRFSSQLLSGMLVAIITGIRFVAVVFPLKVSLLSVETGNIIIVSTCIIATLLGCYGSILFEIVSFFPAMGPVCLVEVHNFKYFEYCNLYITKIFGEVIITVVISISTVVIIHSVFLAFKRRRAMSSSGVESAATGKHDRDKPKVNGSKPALAGELHMTSMLISVALSFILLKAPYTICWYLGHYKYITTSLMLHQATNISYTLSVMFHAINFFLYSLSGSSFRLELKGMIKSMCSCHKVKIDKPSENVAVPDLEGTSVAIDIRCSENCL